MKTKIEPTIPVKEERLVEADIAPVTLQDLREKYGISTELLMKLLNRYFSAEDLLEIEQYVCRELDIDIPVTEAIDTSADALLDKVPSSEIKNMVKSAGVPLKGNETNAELKGMVKALSTKESRSTKLSKFVR